MDAAKALALLMTFACLPQSVKCTTTGLIARVPQDSLEVAAQVAKGVLYIIDFVVPPETSSVCLVLSSALSQQ